MWLPIQTEYGVLQHTIKRQLERFFISRQDSFKDFENHSDDTD